MKLREVVSTHWAEIRRVAGGHGVDEIRWWPPTYGIQGSADFLVDGELGSLRELRADLERELGCQVAIYLAHQAPPELMPDGTEQAAKASTDPSEHDVGSTHVQGAETHLPADVAPDPQAR